MAQYDGLIVRGSQTFDVRGRSGVAKNRLCEFDTIYNSVKITPAVPHLCIAQYIENGSEPRCAGTARGYEH